MNYSQLSDRHKKDFYLGRAFNKALLNYLYDNCLGFNDTIATSLFDDAKRYTESKGIEYISEILGYLDGTLEPKDNNQGEGKR